MALEIIIHHNYTLQLNSLAARMLSTIFESKFSKRSSDVIVFELLLKQCHSKSFDLYRMMI